MRSLSSRFGIRNTHRDASALLRPGVRLGDYPERSPRDHDWLESVLRNGVAVFNRSAAARKRRWPRFIKRVNECGREIKGLKEEQLCVAIHRSRCELLKYGFIEDAVARTFAMIREIADRRLKMRHHDVQLIGGWIILTGMLAEMQTGEGKTLTATLPACTAALAGIPVHIVSVNDYLVTRDAALMEPVYRALGLTVGTVTEGMGSAERRAAYACDITYCSNKQLVFDYLKDRLVLGDRNHRLHLKLERIYEDQPRVDRLLLRGLCFAIVDEADSVLIDEARTPLILSRPCDTGLEENVYHEALSLADQLEPGTDYRIKERERDIELTDHGRHRLSELTKPLGGLWTGERRRETLARNALSARHLYVAEKHYLVRDGKVQIVDEHTGRTMVDRAWEGGLHQMLEVKEGCELTARRDTLARISYQRFFRRYLRLAGMTGTAREARRELRSVYDLEVVRVPTHKSVKREHKRDRVCRSTDDKWVAIVERVGELHRDGRPVLVGTRTVRDSEYLSRLLADRGLEHQVLHAGQDSEEAMIISRAGKAACITVATNMAGRGTDICLAAGVAERGGLHVIAAERNTARRIDRQLAGRCARQGDPGRYEAILSLEDEVVTVYGGEFICRFLGSAGIGLSCVGTALIWWSQRRAERHHRHIRRTLFKMDEQRSDLLAFAGRPE